MTTDEIYDYIKSLRSDACYKYVTNPNNEDDNTTQAFESGVYWMCELLNGNGELDLYLHLSGAVNQDIFKPTS